MLFGVGSWVAVGLGATDPEVEAESEDEQQEEQQAVPLLTAEQTVELFDEIGGYFSDDDESEPTPENTTAELPESGAQVLNESRPATKVGRRPASEPIAEGSDRDTAEPEKLTFLQPVRSLVREATAGDSVSLEGSPAPGDAEGTTDGKREAAATDKHGFPKTDGRGRASKVRSGEAVDWLLGNHADELTPCQFLQTSLCVSIALATLYECLCARVGLVCTLGIPLMTARTSDEARFWILPCCFWGFSRRFAYNDTRIGQYPPQQHCLRAPICSPTGPNCLGVDQPAHMPALTDPRWRLSQVQELLQLYRGHHAPTCISRGHRGAPHPINQKFSAHKPGWTRLW